METIVVGLDGSKDAQTAARWAARHAQQSGARIVAVHAVPPSDLWSLSAIQFNTDELLTELRELLDGPWAAPLREAGVEYTTELVGGDPALELLRVAERVDASMLVLGSKGRSTLADLVVGGTVHKLINRCTVPVVVVPRSRPVKEDA
jgi:nucleotide-binding universal stress UspA family protein